MKHKQTKKDKILKFLFTVESSIGGTIHLLKSRLPHDDTAKRAIELLENGEIALSNLRNLNLK